MNNIKMSLKISGPYEIIKIYKNKKTFVEIFLLGTAHVSKESVKDVEEAFFKFQPDVVCIELCKSRYESLVDPEKWKKLDITRVIKEKKIALLASSLILSSFQKRIGLQIGTVPGSEMLKASELANNNNIQIQLIDRDIRTTLLRVWRSLNLYEKFWLINYLMVSLIISEEVTNEQIEQLKQKDVLEELFENLPSKYNRIKNFIIDERDQYMAENIKKLIYDNQINQNNKSKKIKKILVVVGAGHLKGIKNYLQSSLRFSLDLLNLVPPSRPIRTLFTWIFLSSFIGTVFYLLLSNSNSGKDLVWIWAISRSLGAGFGAILALAHPITIIVTMLMAPFSIFIPGSRLWMFSALTEVWIHKPRVEDFERIAEDTMELKSLFKSLYRNRILKLFWIITLVSTGLTIGNLTFLQKFIKTLIELIL